MTDNLWTKGPWGVEQTSQMLWVGPMRPDGHKVDQVVVGLNIDRELTVTAALRQHRNAHLIASAPELADALEDFLIHSSMGWEVDGLMDNATAVLRKARGEPA